MTPLRLIAGLVLLGACLWLLDARAIAARLAGADPLWLSVAVAALLAQTVLMALRWRLVARGFGTRMAPAWAIREYLAGQLVNATLPGGVLGDAARAVRASDGKGGMRGAAHAVVIERAAGQIGLVAVAGIGLAGALLAPGGFAPPTPLAVGMVAGIAAIAVATVALTRRGDGADIVRRCLPSRDLVATHAALSMGAAALNVAAFAACARATGTVLGPGAALVLVPLILTAMLVPLTVGGWGWREGAAAALFPVAGAPSDAGVAAGIAFGAVVLISVLPGVAVTVGDRRSGHARSVAHGPASDSTR